AAHSSDLALFESAALLPWLLWLSLEAGETGRPRWFVAAGLFGGCLVLTGSIDGAAYGFFALICFAASWVPQIRWTRALLVVVWAGFIAALLGAIVILPWLNVAPYTTRTGINAPGLAGASLDSAALGTTVSADYLGLISGRTPELTRESPEDFHDPRQQYL